MIQVSLQPRVFAQAVLESVCGSADMVTDGVINKFNEWLNKGNKKESYAPAEIEVAANFIMGR